MFLLKFFFYQGFLHRHWRFTGQQGKRGNHLLFHSTTSTRSQTLRTFFTTLHVRWLSHIFNRNACVYQTATRWDLPPYRITIWVIDWWCSVCLFTWWIDTRFCYSDLTLETGGLELPSTITLVLQANQLTQFASHPSEPTNYILPKYGIIDSSIPTVCSVKYCSRHCLFNFAINGLTLSNLSLGSRATLSSRWKFALFHQIFSLIWLIIQLYSARLQCFPKIWGVFGDQHILL